LDPLHAFPALPAGLRVLDAFVCDGPGFNGTAGVDDYMNAGGFSGRLTPGIPNLCTATPEVLRTLPHWHRLVHETLSASAAPRVGMAEATVHYRERFNGKDPTDPESTGIPNGADYGASRRSDMGDLRGERGLASPGELMLLNKAGGSALGAVGGTLSASAWKVGFAADPVAFGGFSARISTDVFDPLIGGMPQPDEVAGDIEESNLLFSGVSNMVTTRSDVFTVYFKVRSFRQNPLNGVWDATDSKYIVDDSRYVMLVDRSQVNRPTDKPRILYLERLPK
ncbi:MAG: hypothetical protein ACYSTY_11895, partial [Planctomycetota bacterium]